MTTVAQHHRIAKPTKALVKSVNDHFDFSEDDRLAAIDARDLENPCVIDEQHGLFSGRSYAV